MLKPESVIKFYAYTTKAHRNDVALELLKFDEVHLEPPQGIPGVRPPNNVESDELEAYEEIVRTLERTSTLVGVPMSAISSLARRREPDGIHDSKKMISELDEAVGEYLRVKRELEISKKVKHLLRERAERMKEIDSRLSEIEGKISSYYAATLEVVEEDPSKLRLGRALLEMDRGLLRTSSLLNMASDKSLSLDDVGEVIKNAKESLRDVIVRIETLLTERKDISGFMEIDRNIREISAEMDHIINLVGEYRSKKEKLSELRAIESLWNKMKDSIKRIPELSPIMAEREPAISKVSQQIGILEEEIKGIESEVRRLLFRVTEDCSRVRREFSSLREGLLSIKVIAAGEAERRVSELIEDAKPLMAERGKLEEELDRLKRLTDKKFINELREKEKELKQRIIDLSAQLAAAALRMREKALIQRIEMLMYEGEEISVISGWIPRRKMESFKRKLEERLGEFIAIEFEEAKEDEAPSKVNVPILLKPVRLLTHRLYGYPSVVELDPTILTAIFFPLMFGMMYGDLGHGITLALFGFFLWKKTGGAMKELGGLLIYSGIAAAIFGYLYGAFFFTSITEHPILSPLHDTMRLMAVALLFGAFQMSVGFLINTMNKMIEGDPFAAFLEYRGFMTLVMYVGAVIAVVRNGADIGGTLRDPLFQAMSVPLLVTCIAPIFRSVKEGHGIGEGLSEMISTLLESVLALLSNSLSYIRLAAFAVIHEVFGVLTNQSLFGKEMVLIGELPILLSPAVLAIFALMNILVMGLEGLLSFIQATRLTFYEFFTKFYRASGREFRRVSELIWGLGEES
ncbi:MAG: hypothetical protein BA066_02230 [Candidatus Korarchaeota archaeon NZ13-K]|nr:MAG: hypothetical protein BA066_02230 [Candidatus Korarchaeota archaeon NZ13-K]